MRTFPTPLRLVLFAAAIVGGAILLGSMGWPQPDRTREFSTLIVAALLVSGFAVRPLTAEDRGMMTPSFVVDIAALLVLGGGAALAVATVGIVTRWIADADRARPWRTTLTNAAGILLATEAAALVYTALGGAMGHFAWPAAGLPIAAAVAVYCSVRGGLSEVALPLLARRGLNRSWPVAILGNAPYYVVGATVAAGLIEATNHEAWNVLLVGALPLFCAYRAYCGDVARIEDAYRRREVLASVDHGMAVVNRAGRITLWGDALERLTDVARGRAIGRPPAVAVPALRNTPLPRAIEETLAGSSPRTLTHFVNLTSPSGSRWLEVRIVPIADGATLLWHDMTERAQADQALKRHEQRLTLAAEGANDGLWEWDLMTKVFYASGRWKAMIGLPGIAGVGACDDWLRRVHPEDMAALKDAFDAHLAGTTPHVHHEHRIRHEDGTYRRYLCHGVAARGANGRPTRIAGSLTDTTEQALAQEQLRSASFRDPLTGLCNRAVFVERLGRRLAELKRQKAGDGFAALYLDLDRFKVVNDSLGHLVGDELLTAVSRRLESCLRQGDALARLGGDEFAILLNKIGDPQQANAVAFRIQKALGDPFSIAGREVFTSASIGIAFGVSHYNNPDEIMRDADTAMYHAKARGKARHELFDADMHARTRDRLGLENDLRHAIHNHDFEVHYQPIVSLASRMCVGFESLIRWTRNGEPVSPATFIPMVEEMGLIEPLGTWVLQQACRTFAGWQRQFPNSGLDCITVNVSSRQLMQQHFMLIVEEAVQSAGLRPCDLRLEITETALMDSPAVAAKLLSELREFGVKIYLDDFGTGYSSLSHLHKLPVDALKIDRSFVTSLVLADRPAIVESILALARTLNTSVVAEGIESDEQASELERLGCTHAQGYLFSRPLARGAVEQLLQAARPLGPPAKVLTHPGRVA